MKFKSQRAREQGSVLLICLGSVIVTCLALAGYLLAVEGETNTVGRSQSWNESMVVAEAGIEDGMAMINYYANSATSLYSWTNAASACGWTVSGNTYSITRTLGQNHYRVAIDNSGAAPVITSVGSAYWSNPLGLGATTISRAVKVRISANNTGLYLDGILTRGGVTMNGGITVLSFNSQLPPWNTNPPTLLLSQYNANATVATLESNVTAEIDATGNVHVYGSVVTGPNTNGLADIVTTGITSIGDLGWVNGGNSGIEVNHAADTLNVFIPPPPPPPAGGVGLPGSGTVNGTNYNYVFTTGTYNLSSFSMSGQQKAIVTGQVNLVVNGSLSMAGQSSIYIAPGAVLTTYVSGSASIAGDGIANGSGNATNLTLIGEGTNSISYTGNSAFVGTIDAPGDSVALKGGGSTPVNFIGALVAQSAQITGGYLFAYDEALAGLSADVPAIYRASSWQEVTPN